MASVRVNRQFIWYILVVSWLPTILSCNLEGLQICGSNEEFKRPAVAVMFSEEFSKYKMTCLRQKEFLACAANWRQMDATGCSQGDLAGLTAFENVHRAVCLNNATAYNRSRSCILKVENGINFCLRIFARAMEDHCQEMEETRDCIRRSVMHETCDDVGKEFLRKITDLSLSPFAHREAFNCEMSTFADQREKETTPELIATLEAETSTSTMEAETAAETSTIEAEIAAETATKEAETAAETATTAVETVTTSAMPLLTDTGKGDTSDSKATLTLQLVGDNGASRHSTSITRVTALFVVFLSVCAGLVL